MTHGTQQIQPQPHVRILSAGLKMNRVTLAEQGCQIAGRFPISEAVRGNQHVGQPWMHRQGGHLPAVFGNTGMVIQGAEGAEKFAGAFECTPGRRIEPFKFARIVHAPQRKFQGRTGQVGLQNFRPVCRCQRVMCSPGPQAQADTRPEASGASPPLFGRRLGYRDGDQAGQAAAQFKSRYPLQPAVHHHPDALDGQAGFGNGGGQHDLAFAGGCRRNGLVLGAAGQVAEKRGDNPLRSQPGLLQPPGQLADFGCAR